MNKYTVSVSVIKQNYVKRIATLTLLYALMKLTD